MKYIKKYYFCFFIIILVIARFFLSYNLPSFYLSNLRYDDKLMVSQLKSLLDGEYLGKYSDVTLVKGVMFPLFLYVSRLLRLTFSISFTILYILACLFFANSLRKIITNKIVLISFLAFLLFNPVSYSSELFQRIYRNSLSIIELLFFFGAMINIACTKKNNYINYVFLGIITSIMYLTREDTIWTIICLIVLFLYKLYKNVNVKNILVNLIPVALIIINLNVISFINYKYYNIYTYNELSKSNFKNAYKKILQIKDYERKDKVAISKKTLISLAKVSKELGMTNGEIDFKYIRNANKGEISNGNIVWYIRNWIYEKKRFKDGSEANEYFLKLSNEIDNLFDEGVLKKQFAFPSVFINMPTKNEIRELPLDLIKLIYYTSTYKDIKTFSSEELNNIKGIKYDEIANAYYFGYYDQHNSANIIEKNEFISEIIRNIYKYFTIICGSISLLSYLFNIKKKDDISFVIHIILVTYLIILGGIAYTHATAFDSIRYCYLGNIYILQNLFIILNLYRIYYNKKDRLVTKDN